MADGQRGLRALTVEQLQDLRAECEREIAVRYRARAPEEDLRAVVLMLDRVEKRLARVDGAHAPSVARRMQLAAERRPARGGG